MKLWGGRFEKDTSHLTDAFNASIEFDRVLYPYDILGSVAHVRMLAKQNIIELNEAKQIEQGLFAILDEIEQDTFVFQLSLEDIHMNIEANLINQIGAVGKKLHTGRSRNDQVALDMKLYTKQNVLEVADVLKEFIQSINNIAKEHTETIMPGFTHLQPAQPITLAHHLLAHVERFKRDLIKLRNAVKNLDSMPLGSGALASTSYPIDRDFVKDTLGFTRLTDNSLDAVSDRDYLVELLTVYSLIGVHFSQLSEEIILWNTKPFSFITLDDAYSTGSSIMPQKKNPDIAELSRGKAGRMIGHLMQLLTTIKGLPLAYNKDLQEDKESFFDATNNLKLMMTVFKEMLETTTFHKERMYQATLEGYTEATDLADYLVKKGVPFRECHEIIGNIVHDATALNKSLLDITISEYKTYNKLFEDDLYAVLDLKAIVNAKTAVGGPAFETTRTQTVHNDSFIKNFKLEFARPLDLLELLKNEQ